MRDLRWTVWLGLVCLLLPAVALGQDDGEDAAADSQAAALDYEDPLCRHQGPTMHGDSGLWVLRSGTTMCKGQWAFGSYWNLWTRRVTGIPGRDPLWNDWDLEHQRVSVGFGYGVTDKIELSLAVPYEWYDADGNDGFDSAGNPLLQGGTLNGRTFIGTIDASGLGNLRLGAKFALKETPSYALALNAFVDLPTGDDDEAVVTGDTGFGAGLNWSLRDWVINVGYFDPGDPDIGEVSDQIDLGFGYAKPINERFEWITELVGAIKTENQGNDGEHNDLDVTSGGRYYFGKNGDWAFNFGLRVDLSDLDFNYTPIGGVLGLTWSPRRSWDLETSTAGSCDGTVETDPAGANCSGSGRAQGCGQQIQLVATPADPTCCEFDRWEGDCEGGAQTSVTMDGPKSCTAFFRQRGPFELEVEKTGQCTGEVSIDPARGEYECGEKVELEASGDRCSIFKGWSGDCSGNAPKTSVTMTDNRSCTAAWECGKRYESKVVEKARASCYFQTNKAKLDNRCKLELDQVALAMKDHPDAAAEVVGHTCCDKKASDKYLQKLSAKRAKAVVKYLVKKHGIDASRFEAEGAGCAEAQGSDDPLDKRFKRADVVFKVKTEVEVKCN